RDVDLALGPAAAAAAAARECDERRNDEDRESSSSNHLFPLCVYEEARKFHGLCLPSFAALFPTQILVGARVRRRRMRPHGMAEPLLRSELWTRQSLQVKPEIAGPWRFPANVRAALYQYGSAAL